MVMIYESPKCVAGKFGKYTCTRCGWKWTPRGGCPDPPHACARCRTAYWQTAPMSSRANSPEDPKWRAERDLAARRRRERHLVKLSELAAEFGLEPPPIEEVRAITPARYPWQAAAPSTCSRDRFNEGALPSAPAGPLSQELARLTAQSEVKTGTPLPSPIAEPPRGRGGYGKPTRGIAPSK
jgi:hypothetical protein